MEQAIHTSQQLGQVLRGQRKSKKLTQQATAASVGMLPKTVSALESAPGRSSVDSLFKLLSALDVELVLRSKVSDAGRSGRREW